MPVSTCSTNMCRDHRQLPGISSASRVYLLLHRLKNTLDQLISCEHMPFNCTSCYYLEWTYFLPYVTNYYKYFLERIYLSEEFFHYIVYQGLPSLTIPMHPIPFWNCCTLILTSTHIEASFTSS